MAQRIDHHLFDAACSALIDHGPDGAREGLRIIVNEASKIERAQLLNARPFEQTPESADYSNGFNPKIVMTRVGEQTFNVLQLRGDGVYPSALDKRTSTARRAT